MFALRTNLKRRVASSPFRSHERKLDRRFKKMRSLRMLLGLLFLFGTALTAKAQKVSIDYDRQVNFSDYKTFSWIRAPHYRPDPLMDQRITDAVNGALTAKG